MNRLAGYGLALALAWSGLAARGALAADAAHPYGNVDHRVDAGNDTGDSQVDRLNQQQLDRIGGDAVRPAPSTGLRQGYGYGYGGPPRAYGLPVVVAVGPYHRGRRWWRHHRMWVGP